MTVITRNAISEIVYENILQMLFDGIYPPGSPISRKELAEKMDVSPTPVGEAIARLQGEGIIERYGKTGYRVREFSDEDLAALYEVRAGLEAVAIRICVERASAGEIDRICRHFDPFYDIPPDRIDIGRYTRADQDFHRQIVAFCRNSYIISYDRHYDFLLRSYQKGLLRAPADTIAEHRRIVDAIRNREPRTAEFLMIDHHMTTSNNIRDRMKNRT